MLQSRFLWLALTCAFFPAFADIYAQRLGNFFHHLTTEQGLSQANNAYCYHDSRGFVWVSSIDGLNRFDGLNTKVYRPKTNEPNSMLGQNIQSNFFEDANGDLWFCTYEGVNCYRRQTDDFEHWQLTDPTTGDTIREDYYAFHFDRNGQLWLRLGGGKQSRLFLFDTRTKQVNVFGSLLGNRCFVDTSGTGAVQCIYSFFFAEKKGLYKTQISDGFKLVQSHFIIDQKSFFSDLFIENHKLVWLAGSSGLTSFDTETGLSNSYPYIRNGVAVGCASIRPIDNRVLAVSSSGSGFLFFDRINSSFTKPVLKRPERGSSLSGNNLNDLHIDRDRNIWVSDWMFGLNFFNLNKPKFDNILLKDIDPLSGYIQAIVEDRFGHVWCAMSNGVILKFDGQSLVAKFTEKNGLPNTYLPWLYCDRKGIMWVVTENEGVFWYDEKTSRFRLVKGSDQIPTATSPCLRELNDGSLFLTHDDFYNIIRNPGGTGFRLQPAQVPGNIDPKQVMYYYQDKRGNFYFNLNAAQIVCVLPNGNKHKLKLNNLKACYEDPDGQSIWLATTYGLEKMNLNTFESELFHESNGLPNQYLYSVVPDSMGFLWLSSNKGILRFNPADKSNHTRQYNIADGVWENEFYTNAWLRTSTGAIWMGNKDVLNIFRPEQIVDVSTLAKVQITNLKVNDLNGKRSIYIGECSDLQFHYSENTLSFDFVALEYSDPANNHLTYTLEGYDKKWVDIPPGAPGFARYAKLPPGNYTLKIKASNSDGVWNPTPRALHIHIMPPFWQTWWFIILVTGVLLGIGFRIYKYRLAQLRKAFVFQQKTIESEMKALRAQINPHFIFNSLNSINAFILRNEGKIASGYLTEFAHLMRQILDNSTRETISLENEIEFLQSYLRVEALRLENKLIWEIQISNTVDTFETEIPSMILQPYIENAIWHGIAPKSGSGKISIAFERDVSGTLQLTVADDGIGRTRAQELKADNVKLHESKGLKITEERLALFDQKHGTQSVVITTDLVGAEGNGIGTRVDIRISRMKILNH